MQGLGRQDVQEAVGEGGGAAPLVGDDQPIARAHQRRAAQRREDRRAARSLIVQNHNELPNGDDVAVIVLGCHLMPSTITRAIENVVEATQPGMVVLSGGRTKEDWPEDMTEAALIHRDLSLSKTFNYQGRIEHEAQSTNTRENFTNVVREYGVELWARPVVILTHNILTGRARMAARQAFTEARLMDHEAFDRQVSVTGYDAKVRTYSPENPDNLAAMLARIKVYGDAGDIALSAQEQKNLQFLYTRAAEYASKGSERDLKVA